jgi:hypothetical protein
MREDSDWSLFPSCSFVAFIAARFRAKKKAKSINLERSVTDLQGRIGDLEVERGELKKENGWLKGIVTSQVQRRNGRGVGG